MAYMEVKMSHPEQYQYKIPAKYAYINEKAVQTLFIKKVCKENVFLYNLQEITMDIVHTIPAKIYCYRKQSVLIIMTLIYMSIEVFE